MNDNFWMKLGKNIFALAPMEDVTDTVFREIVMKAGSKDILNVVYTEFCSTDGLCSISGRKKVAHRLFVTESERQLLKKNKVKLVAQLWGNKPEKFKEAIEFINNEYEFDGIDINMGCPVKKIVKQGSCSALIGQAELAREIFLAAKESTNLPISIKTRTGLKRHTTEEWLSEVFSWNPAAVILHCRTQSDQSERPADWNQMNIAVKLKDSLGLTFPLLGNGDIFTREDANNFIQQTGADGVMFGRGIFRNPWLFNKAEKERSPQEKIELLNRHVNLFEETWGNSRNFSILKRFFKIYISSFDNSSRLKTELMNSTSLNEVKLLINNELNEYIKK